MLARKGTQIGQVADLLWISSYEQRPLLENMLGWVNHSLFLMLLIKAGSGSHLSHLQMSISTAIKSLFYLCADFIQNTIHTGEALRGDLDKLSVSLDLNWGLLVGFLFSETFLNYEAVEYLVKGKVFIHLLYLPVLLELASPQHLTGNSSMSLGRTYMGDKTLSQWLLTHLMLNGTWNIKKNSLQHLFKILFRNV